MDSNVDPVELRVTGNHLRIMVHALGSDGKHGTYRNRLRVSAMSSDMDDLMDLVVCGLMIERQTFDKHNRVFHVSRIGKSVMGVTGY